MAPRPRKKKNRDLPDYLYHNGKSYYYLHPIKKTTHGMGTDKARAIRAAKTLNAKLLGTDSNLVARVIGAESIASLIARFRAEYLIDKKLAASTLAETEYRLKRYERELGDRPFEQFDLAALSAWLRPLTRESYIKHRGQWIDIYRFACSVGLCDRNIAELTLKKPPQERVRKRWTVEQYKATYAEAEPWLRVAMGAALVSLQRREDLTMMRFDDIEGGRIKVLQRKTGKRLAIKIGASLDDILRQARDRSIVCPYIIARQPDRLRKSKKIHPFQVTPDFLTQAVADARDRAAEKNKDLFKGYVAGEFPTLHELRSLGAHLYREAGYPEEYIQALLGHESRAMTQVYLDGHKVSYDEVAADLRLEF